LKITKYIELFLNYE